MAQMAPAQMRNHASILRALSAAFWSAAARDDRHLRDARVFFGAPAWLTPHDNYAPQRASMLTPCPTYLNLPRSLGAIAQLGERDNGIVEVIGSIPIGSTIFNVLVKVSASPSSRGLGHRPFTAVTGVRIPLGTPYLRPTDPEGSKRTPEIPGFFVFGDTTRIVARAAARLPPVRDHCPWPQR